MDWWTRGQGPGQLLRKVSEHHSREYDHVANILLRGNTTVFDRMIEYPVANTQTEMHTYALNWTAEALTWIIDGKAVRTLKYGEANGGKNYPQTPCNVRLGPWAGGSVEDKGTVEWAGGKTDFSKGPFTMTVESVKVINYSPGTEYKWTDKTGSFESIEVVDAGKKEGAPQNTKVIEASATAPGAPLASGIDTPAEGEVPAGSGPAQSTPCTSGANQTTAAPVAGGLGNSGFAYPTGGAAKPTGGAAGSPPTTDDESDDKPCDCGTAVVTVTGAPPAATFSTKYSALPPSAVISSVKTPSVSTAKPAVPSSGLLTETNPPPVVPVPNPSAPPATAPAAVVPTPSRNATASAPAQFTGAASHNKAGVLVGAFAGAVLLAF
jgi:hypothetical protein